MATAIRSASGRVPAGLGSRLLATVDLLRRRGYALPPERLAELCIGGALEPAELARGLREAGLEVRLGLVAAGDMTGLEGVRRRQEGHPAAAALFDQEAVWFSRRLRRLPFVISVAIAGSLASGGFRETDDVDLNLVVEDGTRHLAYVALNVLAVLHALRHRSKPVDAHTARPLVPRLMTANLVLQRSDCFPLLRQDVDMAYELLTSRPVAGARFLAEVLAANPELVSHFPQLARRFEAAPEPSARRLPAWLLPPFLDGPARVLGGAAWRSMQWARRRRPEALARVEYVRATMRPYALFDEPQP